jgi:hypothetical protein
MGRNNKTQGGLGLQYQCWRCQSETPNVATVTFGTKKGNKWYIKFFERLQNVAVHNTTVHYVATTGNQKLEYLSF